MALKGIDTSSWQAGFPDATIDADFIIFKATEGVGYTDADCNPSYQEAKAAGKLVGVYHFARPDGNDPISEANWFLSQIQGYIGEAIMVLDWETEPKSNVAWAKAWLDRVFAITGIHPMIYMSTSVVNAHDWSSVANAGYALWVAQYRDNEPDYNYDMSNAGTLPDVKWWKEGYAMWQWTSSGRLTGWGGNLDCNIFYGDKASWKAFAQGHPEIKPPVITTTTTTIVPPKPKPTTTTTTTTVVPATTTTTTTTTTVAPSPINPIIPPFESIWQKIWNWIINFIRGVK